MTAITTATPDRQTYTSEDLGRVTQITEWLRLNGKSRSWMATKAGISGATVSTILNGKYPAVPTPLLSQMWAVIGVESERLADVASGYVEGSVHRLSFTVCDRTRKTATFGAFTGFVGVGKTRSLKEYKARKPQTLLIESNPQMTAGCLLTELLEQMNVAPPAGMDAKFSAVVKGLVGTNHLIIVDEAENLSTQALHYLRRIRDKSSVGVVLAGTEKLLALIKPEHGQFDQIRSRVAMWPQTIEAITRDDADDIVRDALRDVKDLPDDVLEALWAYCKGSARVLTESLIPALRDYGLGRQALNAALIDAIAQKVLFMAPRRKG